MKLAVIQVRGVIGMNRGFKDTLKFLKLAKKNSCAVVENNRNYLGMLVKLRDYVTWGELDAETCKKLLEKRARLAGNKALTEDYIKSKMDLSFNDFCEKFISGKTKLKDVPGLKPFFRLMPPKGGYGREGIKKQYSLGGALGYRGKNINNLIGRML